VPQVLCPVLVGRDEEARLLRAALTAARAGRGSTVFVAGEAGIGKSRLVREVTRTAAESGLAVLAGRAVAGGAPTPFRPFAEALTSAGRAGRLPSSEELGPFRPVLGRLIPEWRPPQPVPGEESPVFLGEAVLRLLRALAPQAGCVLVLEDLHWADQETLALLEYLADNLAAERAVCLATLREAGYEQGGEAAALASALAARGSAAVLALGRLDPAAMADMTRACLDAADLPAGVHAFVAGRAEGIPFLVEEVLAGLVGEGTLTERDGRWHAADLSVPGVPATFADAVRRRLDGMSAESRRVIGAAAVLGRRFDWTLLGPVTGLADPAVIAALREGVGLQLVVAERDGFRFRHALTHEAVLAGLLPPERTMLAGRRWRRRRRAIQACRTRGARWPPTWPGGPATQPGPARCCSRPGGATWPRVRWPAPSTR
jgi:predicted ATPase